MYFHLELRGQHAGELSYVLGKNPDRLFEWEVQGNMVRVFFPIHQPDRTRAVVVYWPDGRTTVRRGSRHAKLEDYVNPRPYAINSLFCVALKTAFNSAVSGHRQAPQEVLDRTHELELVLSPVCTYLSVDRVQLLFEPLGYQVTVTEVPGVSSDEFNLRHPRIYELTLQGRQRVTDVLRHVMILALVMDSDRHEYIGQNDIERLRRFGQGWLEDHPERMFIVSRYLIYRRLIDAFLQSGLGREAESDAGDGADDGYDASGEPMPVRHPVDQQRYPQIADALLALPSPPARVLQVGCGDGRLLAELISRGAFEEVVGTDPSVGMLERARKRVDRAMRYGQALRRHPTRFELLVSSLGYHDSRLHGFDAVVLGDAVTELDEERLPFFVGPILDVWQPRFLVIAVANREWGSAPGEREGRHAPERSEWDRAAFQQLCEALAAGRPYSLDILGLGASVPERGAPIQMGVFAREEAPHDA